MTNYLEVKDVQINEPDLAKVFVYKSLRLAIGPKVGPIRHLGIINEDGLWCYHLTEVDADLQLAERQSHNYINLVYTDKYKFLELRNYTNSSRDKFKLAQVQVLTNTAKMLLAEAQSYVESIKNQE